MENYLPADRFAREVVMILAQGDITLAALATSMGVHPNWLERVVSGEITQLTLLTVMGICRRMRVMPEDIWDPGLVARVFAEFPPNAFDPDDG